MLKYKYTILWAVWVIIIVILCFISPPQVPDDLGDGREAGGIIDFKRRAALAQSPYPVLGIPCASVDLWHLITPDPVAGGAASPCRCTPSPPAPSPRASGRHARICRSGLEGWQRRGRTDPWLVALSAAPEAAFRDFSLQRVQTPQVQLTHYLAVLRTRITNGISRNIGIHLQRYCVTGIRPKANFCHTSATHSELAVVNARRSP